jgi:hypothetical protein
MKTYKNILVISDLHCPYNHPDTVRFLAALKKKYGPFDYVVSSGDEVDYHAMSFHDSDPDLDSAGKELEKAIEELKPIYKLFPKTTVLESNHGSLVLRKALANGMPRKLFKSYRDILEAPRGWNWTFDLTLKTPLGKVYFHHSKGVNAKKNSQAMGMSFVQGHHHEQMDIQLWGNPNALLFGMTVGCLVDAKALAMAYNKNNLKRPVIGCGLIKNGIPQLVPMVLNKKGRWIGRL